MPQGLRWLATALASQLAGECVPRTAVARHRLAKPACWRVCITTEPRAPLRATAGKPAPTKAGASPRTPRGSLLASVCLGLRWLATA